MLLFYYNLNTILNKVSSITHTRETHIIRMCENRHVYKCTIANNRYKYRSVTYKIFLHYYIVTMFYIMYTHTHRIVLYILQIIIIIELQLQLICICLMSGVKIK
jgi:hypothetical protein